MPLNEFHSYLPALEKVLDPFPLTIAPDTPLKNVLILMSQGQGNICEISGKYSHEKTEIFSGLMKRASCVLIVEDERPIGILSERDIVRIAAGGRSIGNLTVGEVMVRHPRMLTLEQTRDRDLSIALQVMRQYRIRHLPIVDPQGKLLGIVTPESIRQVLEPSNLLKWQRVGEVMKTQVVCASVDASILNLSQLMAQYGIGCTVIVEGEEEGLKSLREEAQLDPVGIVTERDIVQFQTLGLNLKNVSAQQIMSAPLFCLQAHDTLWTAQQEMQRLNVRRLVITGDRGELRGLLTQIVMLQVLNPSDTYGAISVLQQVIEEQTAQLQQTTKKLRQEVTVRHNTEAVLRKNQEILQLFVQHAPAAIAMFDREMHYLAVSNRWLRDCKLEERQIVGCSHYDIFPKIPAHWRELYRRCLSGEPVRCEDKRFPLNDGIGDWVRWESYPWHNGKGEIGGIMAFMEVLTDRKRLEEKLRQEREWAQVTLKSIGDAVITTDANGIIRELNPVAEQLTGWSAREAQGRPSSEVVRIASEMMREPVESPAIKALQEGRIFTSNDQTILFARNGQEYAIDNSAVPIRDRAGQIVGAVLVFRDVTASRQLARQLSWQATHDALTGLFNRREFERQLAETIEAAKQNRQCHALCYLDLDQFKIVNDTCGHQAGDELLRQISQLLQQRVRATDTLARLGGDEFGVLLGQCSLAQAEQVANTLRTLLQNFRFTSQNKTFSIGVSIGLVLINETSQDLTSVLSAADAACFAAKERGRNCVHVYRTNDRELVRQRGERQWIARIHQALEEDRFCLYVQRIIPVTPHSIKRKISSETSPAGVAPIAPHLGKKEHYEILLRLVDEEGKLVPPMAFIPAAERYDLMPTLDRWVIRKFFSSYEQYCHNQSSCLSDDAVYTINLSGASANNDLFFGFLREQFAQHQISPKNICFEITETTAIANLSQAAQFIQELKQLGCSFALDDFGSGMSSLAYLKHLPVDYLKIDGSFVRNIVNAPIDCAMVECFNRIGHVMGMQTIAEFVEDDETLVKLQSLGVDYAQGYGIAKPRPLTFFK
ncbi:EAL domain-containing protein [Lusitaniella coriacea LEGE 07157]|uniref:EAL domain-containing protein n=1 Tax=Lusitaniella coriacea LEGE 07157 TaxID=945747 RepID=A0A8J7DUU2_9CYAN|nr:EAL domain-containing protein [Lusitaniella coriacea]MBE9114500.1 EAL domain-containing protein [Lusitaniella coriacea LEGE 07157]